MDIFLTILLVFVVIPIAGKLYCDGVHYLGAWLARHLPIGAFRILTKRLWTTEWDRAREVDKIALEREDRLNKRVVR